MKSILKTLENIAYEAGKIIIEGFHATKEIRHKGAVDLVTQYDVQTENYIIEFLSKHFPEYQLVGEESYSGEDIKGKVIYIDPIDGTTNFIHGLPHVALSIGMYCDGDGVAGVVYNPILEEMFVAQKNQGAYCNGVALHTSNTDSLQQALIATGFPYVKVNKGIEYQWVIDAMREILPHIRDIRRFGAAALDLCYLAQGKVDGFYEIDLKPWDVAAGAIILQEAGGKISSLGGCKYHFANKSIVASNGHLHDMLIEVLPILQ
ncbi:MAG TPA: inositol monophosphatase [Epsilonproteobacteria bacterium]|nr:inositol monophosphatase [Campylobacterota bacterium]